MNRIVIMYVLFKDGDRYSDGIFTHSYTSNDSMASSLNVAMSNLKASVTEGGYSLKLMDITVYENYTCMCVVKRIMQYCAYSSVRANSALGWFRANPSLRRYEVAHQLLLDVGVLPSHAHKMLVEVANAS